MMMDPRYIKNIKEGMKVAILTVQNKYSTGLVKEIALAPKNQYNEQGIMVRLKNGDIGRVKEIILSPPEQNELLLQEIKKLIKTGENFHTEFKAEALWSIIYNPPQIKESKSFELQQYGQKASKVIIAKSIAAFLNSDGGNLIIGIKENKEKETFDIVGIEQDIQKTKDKNLDSYKRILIDEIIKPFFPSKVVNHLNDYITFEFITIDDKIICHIKIKRSDSRIFLKINDKEMFLIRLDSENRTLDGEKLVDYCIKKWGSR